MPNATNESTTGSAKPSIFVESRVSRHTSQAAISPTVTAIMRLGVATSSRALQCGHSIPSERATTPDAGTVFPHCGHMRMAKIHLAEKQTKIAHQAAKEKRGITWPARIRRGGAWDRYDQPGRAHDRRASSCACGRHGRRRLRDPVPGIGNALRSLPLNG